MAINFPNFLQAQLYKPDYSGIGDVFENYYKGKAMPNDDLIKQIQAQFARPNAEEALTGSRLGNEKTRLENAKNRLEQQQNAAFEAQFINALRGQGNPQNAPTQIGGGTPQQMQAQGQQMPQMTMPQQQPNPDNMTFQQGQNPLQGLPPALMQVIQQMRQQQQAPQGQQPGQQQMPQMGQDAGAPNAPEAAPAAPAAPAAENKPQEMVLEQGNPALASVDAMWDRSPLAQAFLKKKGYEKTVKTERDKKTGAEIVYTKYPSGKILKKIIMPAVSSDDMEGDIPLTKPVLNTVVNQVRGTDAVMPYIDKVLNMGDIQLDKNGNFVKDKGGNDYVVGKNNQLPHSSRSWYTGDALANYTSTISEAIDKYMAATGLKATDSGIKTIKDILERHPGESTNNYLKRLHLKKKELSEDRKKNVRMIQKGLKKYSDFDSPARSMTDEELQAAANG